MHLQTGCYARARAQSNPDRSTFTKFSHSKVNTSQYRYVLASSVIVLEFACRTELNASKYLQVFLPGSTTVLVVYMNLI